jgi:hypothetical protein
VGQRGLGHGAHSPILHGFEHVLIHGGQFGTDDFSTYFDISGKGGHSVFNMYLLMSGNGAHGGTVAFNTHLLASGSIHGGQGRASAAAARLGAHPQGLGCPHTLQ